MIKRLRSLILKSYFLSLLTSSIVIYFLPPIFEKYQIIEVEKGYIDPYDESIIYYADIEGDGNDEQIISYINAAGNHAIQIITEDGGIIDQWNFDGKIPGHGLRLFTANYDEDQYQELYLYYQIQDTLFFDCIEPLDMLDPFNIERVRVCEFIHDYAEPDCSIISAQLENLYSEGNKMVVTVVNSGRAKFPRGIYIYDIFNNYSYKSPKYGISYAYLHFFDLNSDGVKEIIGSSAGAGNIHDSIGVPYSDYSAWVLMYDPKFNLLFDPIEFPGFRSITSVENVSDSLVSIYYRHRGPKENNPEFLLMNVKGEILRRKEVKNKSKAKQYYYVDKSGSKTTHWILSESGYLESFDEDFRLKSHLVINETVAGFKEVYKDESSDPLLLVATKDKSLLFAQNNFRDITKYSFKKGMGGLSSYLIRRKNLRDLIFVQSGGEYAKLDYFKNPLYPIKYLIFLGIFIVMWLFIKLIQKLQMLQLEKKHQIRSELANLQLKSMKNQMDPHFTFNVFNTMALKIKSDSPETYKAFMQFTNLIRRNLESSDHITRSIEEELSYLRSYLELEKLRFPEKLSYELKIDPLIDQEIRIPKMLLQTYVENAIKHGIRHKEGGGLVQIIISSTKSYLTFEIIDDGVGREKAKVMSKDSTGFGLKIMESYFQLFNEYNFTKIKQEINDLYDSQSNACGTKVIIRVPLKFNYKLRNDD